MKKVSKGCQHLSTSNL